MVVAFDRQVRAADGMQAGVMNPYGALFLLWNGSMQVRTGDRAQAGITNLYKALCLMYRVDWVYTGADRISHVVWREEPVWGFMLSMSYGMGLYGRVGGDK